MPKPYTYTYDSDGEEEYRELESTVVAIERYLSDMSKKIVVSTDSNGDEKKGDVKNV